MQADDLLEYRNKTIDAFKDGTFLSELVNKFIQEIKSMEEKINLNLFEEFLNHHHQLIMQKCLLILVQMKTKKWQQK